MAGIGDYVHARHLDYLKSGLSRTGDNPPPATQDIYQMQVKKIKEEAMREKFKNPGKNKQKIEKWLNMFFHPGMKNSISAGTFSQDTINNIQKAIEIYMDKHFDGSMALNPKNLSVSSSDVFDSEKAAGELMAQINKFDSYWTADRRYVESLKKRINALIALRNQLGQKNFKNQAIWKELQNLEKDLDQLEKDVTYYKEISGNTGATIGRFWMTKDVNGERLDEKVDRLIQALKTGSSSKVIGEYAEVVVKATNYVANKKGNATVRQILKYLDDSLKNTSKSNKGVSGEFLSHYATYFRDESALYDSKGNEKNYETLRGDQYTLNLTEDKVDATIDVDKNLQGINLSLKNYNLSSKSDITLLTGRNLLALVQEYPTFVNHFLNIVGTHKDKTVGDYANVSLMHMAMKMTAFLKAIAGGVITKQGRNEAADLFVVNDNSQSTGYYKVYYLSDLLEKVIDDIRLLTIKNYPDGVWMQNKWIESPASDAYYSWEASSIRITNMVNVLRNMALHISISKKALE